LQLPPHATRAAEYNVRLAKGTKLSVLYRYQPSVPIEYPESGVGAPVGHLIQMTPGTCLSWVDFAYSHSAPDGGSAKEDIFSQNSWSTTTASPSCAKSSITLVGPPFHSLGFSHLLVQDQGIKACPLTDFDELFGPAHWHTSATCQDVERCLAAAHNVCQHLSSPQCNIFLHTSAYITAVHQLGCH
jgi:hypothetical protein